ncbi:MAG TPA: hypothetical protein VKD90_05785, partial [Gemmataceae bacterium]|nr:hypothetical protein [Gemmataceae bacterium]
MSTGSWSLAEELFARGDPAFVDELRKVHFADRLGDFAGRWLRDARPFARQALRDYLARPLNTFRHEPLVKRLFKLAEAAGDDELVGAFLVAFDRTVRRQRRTRNRYKQGGFPDRAAASAGSCRASRSKSKKVKSSGAVSRIRRSSQSSGAAVGSGGLSLALAV